MITKKNTTEISARRLSIIAVVLIGGALLTIATQWLISSTVSQGNMSASVVHAVTSKEIRTSEDPYKNITLEARAAYAFDLSTGKALFYRNENEKLPLASITKIMTALVARENISPNVVVTLTKGDLVAEGDTGLLSGERWRISDLLDLMLFVSSNDAASAVASFVGSNGQASDIVLSHSRFVQMMNDKAIALGLNTMEFFNESGLDVSKTQNGGYGSAREVATLFTELWVKYPSSVEITARNDASIYSQDKITHILQNTNMSTSRFPGLVGSKTGFTDLAGGNLTIIFDRGIGSPVVLVVLGSTYKGRFEDMQKLVQATLFSYER